MNIVEMILKALSGDTLKQLSSLVGESPDGVQKAVTAIVPTLLSALGGLASKPQGAEKLFNTLKHVDSEDLGGILKGGAEEVQRKGTNILEDLLGKQSLGALIGPLAKFLTGNTALVSKLLPMIAPFVLSMLAKQVKSGGLDVGGLLKLLMSQRGNIASALPKGLADNLVGVQGLGDLTSFASGAANSVANAGSQAANDAGNWIVPGLVIAALVAAALWFMSQGKPPEKVDPNTARQDANESTMKETAETIKHDAQALGDPVASLTKNFTGLFDSVGGTLDGITDEETAKAAAPKLEEASKQLDGLSTLFNGLPAVGRSTITALLENGQKTLTEKTEKVLGIPGVGELLKPILDGLLEKVAALLKS